MMKDTKILVIYKDESRMSFYTECSWSKNSNKLKLFK